MPGDFDKPKSAEAVDFRIGKIIRSLRKMVNFGEGEMGKDERLILKGKIDEYFYDELNKEKFTTEDVTAPLTSGKKLSIVSEYKFADKEELIGAGRKILKDMVRKTNQSFENEPILGYWETPASVWGGKKGGLTITITQSATDPEHKPDYGELAKLVEGNHLDLEVIDEDLNIVKEKPDNITSLTEARKRMLNTEWDLLTELDQEIRHFVNSWKDVHKTIEARWGIEVYANDKPGFSFEIEGDPDELLKVSSDIVREFKDTAFLTSEFKRGLKINKDTESEGKVSFSIYFERD